MNIKIIKTNKETPTCLSLLFEKPPGFSYYPGQYIDITLPVNDPRSNTRAFTLSSSPSEDLLMITYKKGISKFKKYLFNLKTGDTIESSHPAGTFILDDTQPAIFLAGGIGITPFRSMLKFAIDKKVEIPIQLIYSQSDENFVFRDEFEDWQKVYPALSITYHNTKTFGHLNLRSKFLTSDVIYYLAGPHKMIEEYENILNKLGVEDSAIRRDSFDGY